MARQLRIEYPGAWYHVVNRGTGRRIIYPNNFLREVFLGFLQDIYERYTVCCHAYCLMDNHYHLLVQTKVNTKSFLLKEIVSAVCACKSITHAELLSPSTKEGRMARALALWFCFQHSGYRLHVIAEHFDLGSYTTSSTIIRRLCRSKSSEAVLQVEVKKLRNWLKKMRGGQT